ncbi:MAG: hypothetical protein QXX77_08045 [Candidatus Methanosuratincola sp.]
MIEEVLFYIDYHRIALDVVANNTDAFAVVSQYGSFISFRISIQDALQHICTDIDLGFGEAEEYMAIAKSFEAKSDQYYWKLERIDWLAAQSIFEMHKDIEQFITLGKPLRKELHGVIKHLKLTDKAVLERCVEAGIELSPLQKFIVEEVWTEDISTCI